MVELGVEHVLLFVVAAFLLYRLMGSCGCSYDNGFSVGINNISEGQCCAMGQCKDGLECNFTSPGGATCLSRNDTERNIHYYGICSKPTTWFSDALDTVAGWDWIGAHVTRGSQRVNNRYR